MKLTTDICPRCSKRPLIDPYKALSRRDNVTYICSECGQDEALFDFSMKDVTGPRRDKEYEEESKWLR